MNPIDAELYEGGGNANGLVFIIGWILFFAALVKVIEILGVGLATAKRLLRAIHIIVALFFIYKAGLSQLAGLIVVLLAILISYLIMAKAIEK